MHIETGRRRREGEGNRAGHALGMGEKEKQKLNCRYLSILYKIHHHQASAGVNEEVKNHLPPPLPIPPWPLASVVQYPRWYPVHYLARQKLHNCAALVNCNFSFAIAHTFITSTLQKEEWVGTPGRTPFIMPWNLSEFCLCIKGEVAFSSTPFYDFPVNVHLWWLHGDFSSLFN